MSAVPKDARCDRRFIEARKADPVIDYPAYRRAPGGLLLAVLYAVGDGYGKSLDIAKLLDTSIDNVNGALGRLAMAGHVARATGWAVCPVLWRATEEGMAHLRWQMAEGFE